MRFLVPNGQSRSLLRECAQVKFPECLQRFSSAFSLGFKFPRVCWLWVQALAEESEKTDRAEAMQLYSQAAELFAGEDSTSEASKCRLKARSRLPSTLAAFLSN